MFGRDKIIAGEAFNPKPGEKRLPYGQVSTLCLMGHETRTGCLCPAHWQSTWSAYQTALYTSPRVEHRTQPIVTMAKKPNPPPPSYPRPRITH